MSELHRIRHVHARRIWDSRGRPTVEVDITLASGAMGRGIAPAGASRGSREAIDLRDGGAHLGGYDVQQAIKNVNTEIAQAITGLDACHQDVIDGILITLDGSALKSRLGGNALIATSLAVLQACAAHEGRPLWRHLADNNSAPDNKDMRIPVPEIQIFGGGAHAGRRVDIQDFLLMPIGAESFSQAMEFTARVYRAAGELMAERGPLCGVAEEGGWWPNFASNEDALQVLTAAIERAGLRAMDDVAISLDIAASEFSHNGLYTLTLDNRQYDTRDWIDVLAGWIQRYPILSIEDPVAEDDVIGMQQFTQRFGKKLQIIGDDYLVTNAALVTCALQDGACNAVLIKPNQAGTVTETQNALKVAREAGWGTIVSARSGETEDVTIAHLATGWNAGQLKVGSFTRSERMAKWNEILRIEEALGAHACYAGWSALPQMLTAMPAEKAHTPKTAQEVC